MTNSCLRLLTALTALAAACGCSDLDNCPDAQDRKTIPNKPGTTDVDNLYFESAPDNGPLEPFPAKTELMFEHGLGVKPLLYKAYLSFTINGTANDGDGSVTEVAGNEAPAECSDHRVIVIKNDTCEKSFFIRVVAMGASLQDDGEDHCGEAPE
jgi:hypothetical protein